MRPGCSACKVGSPSPWRFPGCRAAARSWGWRCARGTTVDNRRLWLPPSTRAGRRPSCHARQCVAIEGHLPLAGGSCWASRSSSLFPIWCRPYLVLALSGVGRDNAGPSRQPHCDPCFHSRLPAAERGKSDRAGPRSTRPSGNATRFRRTHRKSAFRKATSGRPMRPAEACGPHPVRCPSGGGKRRAASIRRL